MYYKAIVLRPSADGTWLAVEESRERPDSPTELKDLHVSGTLPQMLEHVNGLYFTYCDWNMAHPVKLDMRTGAIYIVLTDFVRQLHSDGSTTLIPVSEDKGPTTSDADWNRLLRSVGLREC